MTTGHKTRSRFLNISKNAVLCTDVLCVLSRVLLSAGNVLQPGAGALLARVAHFLRSVRPDRSLTLSSSISHSVCLTSCLTAPSSSQWVSRDGPRLHGKQTVLLWTAGAVQHRR